jgi:hypothetical protein
MHIASKTKLYSKALILDGLSGTGKTMFSAVFNSLTKVEAPRFDYALEFVLCTSFLDEISPQSASVIADLLLNQRVYDSSISREVNFRWKDLSSVLQSGKSLEYFKRLFLKDGDASYKRILEKSPIPIIITHNLFPALNPVIGFLDNRVSIVETIRHPLSLIEHWVYTFEIYQDSKRDFTIWSNLNNDLVPWFAKEWSSEYLSYNNYERAVHLITWYYQKLWFLTSSKSNSNILIIPFEKFVLGPDTFIENICVHFNIKQTKHTKAEKKKQNIPRSRIDEGVNKNIYRRYGYSGPDRSKSIEEIHQIQLSELQNKVSAKVYQMLIDVNKEYEKNYYPF